MNLYLLKKPAVVLFTIVLLVLSSSSVKALGDPVKISDSIYATTAPQVVTDSSGYLHIVWMEVQDENKIWGKHQNPGIFYSRWNGDVWSAPLKISENTNFAEIPSITADTNDTVHVVWDDETYGSSGRVAYKTRDSAGNWSAIEPLIPPTGTFNGWNSRVAIGSADVPNVVFSSSSPTGDSIYWSQNISGTWTSGILVSKDASDNDLTDCQWSDMKSDSSFNLHLTYWCWNEGVFYREYNGASWSTPNRIVELTNKGIDYMRMDVTPLGEVFVAYYRPGNNNVGVRWTVGGVWHAEEILTTTGEYSFWGFPIMGVTTDSKERAHVGWGERDSVDDLIDVRFRSYDPGTGVWGTVQDVDINNNDADSPFIFRDLWDNQHFAWTEKNPLTNQWEINYRVQEGTVGTIGTNGGTITANPNNINYVYLSIPSGALSASTLIGIQIGPVPENVDLLQVTIPRAFTFRPNGLVFNSESTATVYYTNEEVAGADERQLRPWFWNSQTEAWEAKDGQVNRAQNKIAVPLSGFSLYGISAPIINSADYLTTFIKPEEDNISIKQSSYLVQFLLGKTDGSEFLPPELAEDLKLVLVDENGETLQELFYGPSGIIKDSGKDRYKGVINFQKAGLTDGNYTIQVHFLGIPIGSKSIILDR